MRIELLREFAVFAKHLNFSDAAVELNLTQSALSKHISAMERELGFALVRRSKPLELTASGVAFLDIAQKIEAEYRDGIDSLRKRANHPSPVRLLWADRDGLAPFLRSVDDAPFEFVAYDGSETFFSEIESGRVDVVSTFDVSQVTPLAEDADLRKINILPADSQRGAIMMSKSNLLAKKSSLSRQDLADGEFLIVSGGAFDHWSACIRHIVGEDLRVRTTLKLIGGNILNVNYVDLGNKFIFLSEHEIRSMGRHRDDVAIFDSIDGDPIELPMSFLYKRDNPNPNVHAFIERARNYFGRS